MSSSILFITLDSCRYDAFVEAQAPNLKSLAPLHRAQSPSHFTYGSHAAFFMGFTPGDASRREPYLNPKYGKIFRMEGGGHPGAAPPLVELAGHNIIDGLKCSLPPQMVPSHSRVVIAAGREMRIVGTENRNAENGLMPLTNM